MSACEVRRLELCRAVARCRERVTHYETVFGRDYGLAVAARQELLEAQEALLALPECGE